VRASSAVAALAAGALVVPASGAAAAQLRPARACYASGETIMLAGSGFTPNVVVSVAGQASPSTDPAGGFNLAPRAMAVTGLEARAMRFVALDTTATMPIGATIDVPVVRSVFATNAPLAGRARRPATWRFAGFFTTGQPIFGHFRTRGRTVRTYRFGLAQGPCGTLVVRAPHLPVRRPQPGRWRLKLDQNPRYEARAPGRIIRFRVAPG
jgi:hypothetical protein